MFPPGTFYDGVKMATKVDTDHRAEHTKIAKWARPKPCAPIVDADKAFHTTYVAEAQKQAQKENKANQIRAAATKRGSRPPHRVLFRSPQLRSPDASRHQANTAPTMRLPPFGAARSQIIAVDKPWGLSSRLTWGIQLRDGDALENFDYRTVLSRALERAAICKLKTPRAMCRRGFPLSELDRKTLRAYKDAQKTIDKLKIDLPVSPIDWIRQRIEAEGYSVAEITGRDLSLILNSGSAPVSRVPTQEQNDKVEDHAPLNDGRLDSLIINVAGSDRHQPARLGEIRRPEAAPHDRGPSRAGHQFSCRCWAAFTAPAR